MFIIFRIHRAQHVLMQIYWYIPASVLWDKSGEAFSVSVGRLFIDMTRIKPPEEPIRLKLRLLTLTGTENERVINCLTSVCCVGNQSSVRKRSAQNQWEICKIGPLSIGMLQYWSCNSQSCNFSLTTILPLSKDKILFCPLFEYIGYFLE